MSLRDGYAIKRLEQEVASLKKRIDALESNVPRGNIPVSVKQEIDNGNVQMRDSGKQEKPTILSQLSRLLYEAVAAVASTHFRAEKEGQLQELRKRLFEEGQNPKEAVRDMWGDKIADAPPELRQAIENCLAMQAMSSDDPSLTGLSDDPVTRYIAKYGKPPHHRMKPETIIEALR